MNSLSFVSDGELAEALISGKASLFSYLVCQYCLKSQEYACILYISSDLTLHFLSSPL